MRHEAWECHQMIPGVPLQGTMKLWLFIYTLPFLNLTYYYMNLDKNNGVLKSGLVDQYELHGMDR